MHVTHEINVSWLDSESCRPNVLNLGSKFTKHWTLTNIFAVNVKCFQEKIDREFKELCTRKALELKASCADLWQRTRTEEIGDTTQYVVAGGYKRFQEVVQKVKTICEAERIFQGVQVNLSKSSVLELLVAVVLEVIPSLVSLHFQRYGQRKERELP